METTELGRTMLCWVTLCKMNRSSSKMARIIVFNLHKILTFNPIKYINVVCGIGGPEDLKGPIFKMEGYSKA